MTATDWLFDGILAALLLWSAWRVLSSRDLFQSVVVFIVFGLLMAFAWARLQAPDVALAEAAIGAALTGALLLDTLGYITARRGQQAGADEPTEGDEGL